MTKRGTYETKRYSNDEPIPKRPTQKIEEPHLTDYDISTILFEVNDMAIIFEHNETKIRKCEPEFHKYFIVYSYILYFNMIKLSSDPVLKNYLRIMIDDVESLYDDYDDNTRDLIKKVLTDSEKITDIDRRILILFEKVREIFSLMSRKCF